MFSKIKIPICLPVLLSVVSLILIIELISGRDKAIALESSTSTYTIEFVPDQLSLAGDVATITNTVGNCTESWLSNAPTGTIILGVDPASCNPADWNGGSVTADIFLPNVYTQTIEVLKISWPDRDGKGLHSPIKNKQATITLDGKFLWGKRTTQLSTFNDFYAAEHEPILTTIVLTQSITHTLRISVPPNTAWDVSKIELVASPNSTNIHGVGYSPYRDCQVPGGKTTPTTQNIRDDLFQLFHTANAIRIYSATGINGQIPALANEMGLPVYAGAWIDYPKTTQEQDDAEIQALINLACTTDLEGLIVGNEYYLRHRTSDAISYLVQRIIQVRNGVRNQCGKNTPITTAEIDNLMFNWGSSSSALLFGIAPIYRPVLDNVDFVMMHIYPFWSGMTIDGAATFTVNRYKSIQALIGQAYPGQNKWSIIGEAGWPSGGILNGEAIPNPRNQEKYLLEFLPLAEQEDVNFLFFDAFDELWKVAGEGSVGQHWGYGYADRTAKYNFYGVLIPAEQLPQPPSPPPHSVYLPAIMRNPVNGEGYPSFPVYAEWPEGAGHFVPTLWMGDVDNFDLYECDRCDPHSGELAVRASFTPTGTLGWAGVYWQYPENNQGNLPEGIDLSWANELTFWARGKVGGEKVRFFVGGIGTKDNPYPDSLRPPISSGFIQLTNQWQKYTINLLIAKPEPSYGQNLSHVIGGFGLATDKCANPAGATFYLDDIYYTYDPNLTPPSPPGPTFAIYTDSAEQGNHYLPSGWMGDAAVAGRVSFSECWDDNPHSGQTSIRIAYNQAVIGWAGIYWLHPTENWGDRPGGYDLSGADRLTFWARSDTPNAQVKFIIGGVGFQVDSQGNAICSSPIEPYPDSVCPKIEQWVTLSNTWTKYTIDLHPYSPDLSKVVGGFGWIAEQESVFYLDDINYEFDP